MSLNVTNEFTPRFNQMGNDHFPRKEYQVRIRVFCWCVLATGEREKHIYYSCGFSPLTLVPVLLSADRYWGTGCGGCSSHASQRGRSRMLLTFSLQESMATPHNSLNWSAVLFPGHEPDRHTVEPGHWSRRQAWGVWLQPSSERTWAAEAAGAGRREEAGSAPGAGEGPAGTATARRRNGRVHTPPAIQCPAAVSCHTSRGYTGTCTWPSLLTSEGDHSHLIW